MKATRKIKVQSKAPKTSKPAVNAKPPTREVAANVVAAYASKFRTIGASGPVRSSKKLSPVVLDRIPGRFTERDQAFLEDLRAQFGTKAFERAKFDGGLMSRLSGHGYLSHVSGQLDEATAKFQITRKAVAERFQTA